uniref:Uncharacterized protein n=1 Tax=Spyridia filamentosa TaxID=196632 RepID=A0A1Z1MJX3_SPYFI|nr:hypothetical protein [Spyridia filamentosa]ARW66189.1 hypothetical protein [Spyridia filamentosa]
MSYKFKMPIKQIFTAQLKIKIYKKTHKIKISLLP